MQAALGVCDDGLRITALPAASAGATLCATVFSGALNGVIAHTTPSGTRSVKPRRPACCGAPSSGTMSPRRLRASSADSRKVCTQRRSSPSASLAGKPTSICNTRTSSSLRCSSNVAARSRIAPRSCGVSVLARNAASAAATASCTCSRAGKWIVVHGCSRYLSSALRRLTPSTQRPAISKRASGINEGLLIAGRGPIGNGQRQTGVSSSSTGEVTTRNTSGTVPLLVKLWRTPGGTNTYSSLRKRTRRASSVSRPSPSSTW